MNRQADYLAELIQSQLNKTKPGPIPEELDIKELTSLMAKNHMVYLIGAGLLQTDNLPEEWKQPLRAQVMQAIAHTLAQVSEVKAFEKACEELQIPNQPMKGARMKFIYPSPEMREMSDIDILIRPEGREYFKKFLLDRGYTLSHEIKHHDIYCRAPFMTVEAHNAMYDKTVDANQYEYFKNMSRAVLREGCSYTYDFTPEDFYVYMIAHMAKHFYAMGCGVRNLLDIYVYLNAKGSSMNRMYVDEELEHLGLLSFTKQMEELAFVWLDRKDGTAFHQQLFDYMLGSGIYGKDCNGIWSRFADDSMKDKEFTPAMLKRWYYFPPLHYMSEFYPWLEDYPKLLPVAWLVRGFKGIFKKKGQNKREMLEAIDKEQIMIRRNIYRKMALHFRG